MYAIICFFSAPRPHVRKLVRLQGGGRVRRYDRGRSGEALPAFRRGRPGEEGGGAAEEDARHDIRPHRGVRPFASAESVQEGASRKPRQMGAEGSGIPGGIRRRPDLRAGDRGHARVGQARQGRSLIDFGPETPSIGEDAGGIRVSRLDESMIAKPSEKPAVDVEALAAALRALGMLYGASQPLAQTIAGAKDEAEAIRMYVERERPQDRKSTRLNSSHV